MSHEHLRKKTDCLNCGVTVVGPYCHNCGQHNIEPKQTLGHLLVHFFNDVTHFNGKFFVTLRLLLLKPGYLSSEYMLGRRTKYLDPVRMYLFISALFLFVFLLVIGHTEQIIIKKDPDKIAAIDSLRTHGYSDAFNVTLSIVKGEQQGVLNVNEVHRHGMAYYDSVQHSLPAAERDNWWQQILSHKAISTYQAYDNDPYNFFPEANEKFLHSFSKIFFISLPIFAFVLYLLYIRRKQFYYVSHAIFSLHFYCLLFICSILIALLIKATGLKWLLGVFIAGLFLYLFVAMRWYYQQHWLKTYFKFIIQSVVMSLVLILLTFSLWLNSLVAMGK